MNIKEQIKDLEKAAEEYSFDSRPSIYGQVDVIDAFKAGAEWQKEQMMKEAVEDVDVELILHDKTSDIRLHTGYLPKELGIRCNEKVKIIIVKED